MEYLIFMIAVLVTMVNIGVGFFVVWLVSELLPDIMKKWRNW
jgi:hypothetical protein